MLFLSVPEGRRGDHGQVAPAQPELHQALPVKALLVRPGLSASDWRAVRQIYRDGFCDKLNPLSFRSTWRVWLWLVVGLVGVVTFPGYWQIAGALLLAAAWARAGSRVGHQEGYESGFREGFERGWSGAHGIDWRRGAPGSAKE
jgi:hypothetical protein